MTWQILILTQHSRAEFLAQLLSLLEPQIAALGLRKFDMVDILIVEDEHWQRPMTLGEKREYMRNFSRGEYICFVDDDDLIAPDYISRVLPLLDGVDIVGWEQECWIDKVKCPQRDLHSIATPGWFNTPDTFNRDISHLQPIRRELALQASMDGGIGEDKRWADKMRALGVVKAEHFVAGGPMYFYLCRTRKDDLKDALDPWRLAFIDRLRSVKV